MADNFVFTPGSGANGASDDIGGVHYQRIKQTLGADGVATADQAGRVVSGSDGAAYVDNRIYRSVFTITPAINTSIYASGDCLGGLNTITNAARYSGGGGVITSVVVLDKTQAQRAAIDLFFFSTSVTSAGNNNPVAFSDADMGNFIGSISILTGTYNTAFPGTPLNSVAFLPDTKTAANPSSLAIPYYCSGSTSLYMQAVVRGTPTYTSASDIVIQLNCVLD